jgi:hypothetical protein
MPSDLHKVFSRDLAAAGIAKRDARGRVVDVHALRHTFGTHLCRAGVPLRTAQAAMRHSDPKLTANVYTDPQLLDVAGAISHLPDLPLESEMEQVEILAEGTNDSMPGVSQNKKVLAPILAPAGGKTGHFVANTVNRGKTGEEAGDVPELVVSDSGSSNLARSGNSRPQGEVARPAGIEPTTFSSGG